MMVRRMVRRVYVLIKTAVLVWTEIITCQMGDEECCEVVHFHDFI